MFQKGELCEVVGSRNGFGLKLIAMNIKTMGQDGSYESTRYYITRNDELFVASTNFEFV